MTFRFLALSASFLVLAAPALALTPAEKDALFSLRRAGGKPGASVRAQFFYHSFKRDRDPAIVVPKWLEAELPALHRRPAWQDPEEGIITEAQLWQAPAAVMYEYFEFVRRSASLVDHHDARVRMAMAVDRLYRAKLGASLGGRGKRIMALFKRVLPEMKTAEDALGRADEAKYAAGVMAAGALMSQAHDALESP